MIHISKYIRPLLEAMDDLPENRQSAMLWLLANYDALTAICKVKPLSNNQRIFYIEQALERDDMYTLVLILFERILNAGSLLPDEAASDMPAQHSSEKSPKQ